MMKRMINKLAAAVVKMRASIAHSSDGYERAINELNGTPAHFQRFETYELK